MSIIALIVTAAAGWLDWSLWLAIPLGLFAFIGARRALPHDADRINYVGVPLYILGTFLLMKAFYWLHIVTAR